MTSQHFGLGYHSDNEIKDTLLHSIMYPEDVQSGMRALMTDTQNATKSI